MLCLHRDLTRLVSRPNRLWLIVPLALGATALSGSATLRGHGPRPTVAARADTVDWRAVDAAMGRPGAMQPGGVYKYAFPRIDVSVRVGAVTLKPALALGGWFAFRPTEGDHAMAMGDLVVLEPELDLLLPALQAAGIQLTALHNHLLNESPHVMYLHIEAHGDPVVIARGLRSALTVTGTFMAPASGPVPPALDLDTALIAQRLGYHGKANGGVYQVSVARQDVVHLDGMEVPPSMGVATAINFQSTGGGNAAIAGDLVLAADEVNPVLRVLRMHGIAMTALHSHMLNEEPRLLFMHFWANDDALKLADGLHAALALMKVKAP